MSGLIKKNRTPVNWGPSFQRGGPAQGGKEATPAAGERYLLKYEGIGKGRKQYKRNGSRCG